MSTLDHRFQAIFGRESSDLPSVTATPELVVEQQQDIAIAEAERDINAVETEIQETQSDMEQLEDRVDDLEAQIDGVESMLNGSRPWNPELAQHMYDRARGIETRTFGAAHASDLKGSECFSDRDTAQLELQAGLLSMKEKAGAAWAQVKQFFINLYNSIVNFFRGLFNRFRGIEGKGQALVTRLNGAADDKIKKEITLGGWNAFVNVEKTKGNSSVGHTTAIAAVAMLGTALRGDMGNVIENQRKAFNKLAEGGESKKSESKSENTETIQFKEGGIEFTIVMPLSSPKDKAAALAGTKITYKVAKEGVKTSGTYASGKSKSDLVSIAQSVVKGAKDAQVSAFKESELKTARDKAIAAIEVADRGGDTDKKDTKEKVAVTRNAHNAGLRAAMVISRFTGDHLNAELGFVSAHL